MNVAIVEHSNIEFKDIKNELKAFQEIVGGSIECPFLGTKLEKEGITFILNEEGKIKGLENSIALVKNWKISDMLVGTIIMCRIDKDGNMASLLEEDKKLIKNELCLCKYGENNMYMMMQI